jgi:dTDP-4-amino-4,6-dideoxygalactose transaminase
VIPAEGHVPFAVPDITEAEVAAVSEALRSGWVTSGPQMVAFEGEFAEHLGGGVEAVAVSSATAGLHLALEACGIGPGDEVILPTWTFTATAEVVRYLGATPVLVDVDPATLNIDLKRVREAVTPSTRAVMPVHHAGLGVDMAKLRTIVGPGIRIIEDAAHALPTITGGAMVGQCRDSDAAVFSFYATKTITTGEGGMITTRDPAIAARARVMRLHGIDRDAFDRYRADRPAWFYDVVAAGFKYNLADPAAAMGRVQLARSDQMHSRRQELAEHFTDAFADLPVTLPVFPEPGDTHAWHLYVVRLAAEAPVDRDGFIAAMSDQGIGTSVHFIPLHMHSIWRESLGVGAGHFPVATREFAGALSLPLFSAMTDAQASRVVDTVRRILT